jgi:hypothetical protein
MREYTEIMEILRKDQIEFAREILAIAESTKEAEILSHLLELSGLLISWVGKENSVAVNLSEYLYELTEVMKGNEDTGWKDEFKKKLLEEIKASTK